VNLTIRQIETKQIDYLFIKLKKKEKKTLIK